jgi:hypothetical protein
VLAGQSSHLIPANFLVNPAEDNVKGTVISLETAVGIGAASGMTVSGFGDAPKRR